MLKTDRSGFDRPNAEAAEAVGIRALEFVAADAVLFHRFLALSGLELGQLRAAAAEPGFFAGLLDFILAHEPTLIAFAAAAGLSPQAVSSARERLGESFGAVPR